MQKFDKSKILVTESYLRGLRQRLLMMILVAVVPILGWILYQAKVARDVQIDEAQEAAWVIVETVAVRESRFIESAQQLLTLLADISEVISGDAATCGRFLKQLTDHNKIYLDLGVADADGEVRCRAQYHLAQKFQNIAGTSHFQRTMAAKTFAVGDYQADADGQNKRLNFGYPIVDAAGKPRAVIFAALNVSWINQLAAESKLAEGVALSIVDSKGTLLARFPEPEKWIGKHIPDAPLFEMLQLRSQSTRELIGLDGVDRLYAFKSLGSNAAAGQIYLMVGVPKEVAFGEANRTLMRSLIWLFVVSMLATGVASFASSKFVIGYVQLRAEAGEAQARLAAIVDSSEDAIISMTLDGVITTWNQSAESMYGYSAGEMIGKPLSLLISPERRGEMQELLEMIKRGRGINRYESERIRKDGGRLEVSASFSPIRDAAGSMVGVSTINRDVTLMRDAMEQLVVHAKHLEALHFVAQDVGGTLSLEEVITRALGQLVTAGGFDFAYLHFADGIAGRKFFAVSRETHSTPELEEIWARLGTEFEQRFWLCQQPWFVDDVAAAPDLALADGVTAMRALAVLPLSGDERSTVSMALLRTGVHVFDPQEKQFLEAVARQIALALDNARLYGAAVQANNDMRGEIEERKRAEKNLAEFTAMIVHDLRSPLSNVISIAESIGDGLFGTVNEMQKKWLWKIQTNCRSLVDHVSDFLDWSKIDAGKLELHKEITDLDQLLHESLVEYSIEADKRVILLKAEIAKDLPRVELDPRRINQVLGNLLSNALKFTENGGQIEVIARTSSEQVEICVEDSGVGIDADDLECVFESYRQVSSSRTSSRKGTGLGLVICKEIIEAHGGSVWVESEVGRGSRFYFSLPMGSQQQAGLTAA